MIQTQINGHTIVVNIDGVWIDGKRMVPEDGSELSLRDARNGWLGNNVTISNIGGGLPTENKTLQLDRDGQIQGNIEGDLTIQGSNVTLVINGNINGDVSCPSGNVTANVISGDVQAQKVTANVISGDVSM